MSIPIAPPLPNTPGAPRKKKYRESTIDTTNTSSSLHTSNDTNDDKIINNNNNNGNTVIADGEFIEKQHKKILEKVLTKAATEPKDRRPFTYTPHIDELKEVSRKWNKVRRNSCLGNAYDVVYQDVDSGLDTSYQSNKLSQNIGHNIRDEENNYRRHMSYTPAVHTSYQNGTVEKQAHYNATHLPNTNNNINHNTSCGGDSDLYSHQKAEPYSPYHYQPGYSNQQIVDKRNGHYLPPEKGETISPKPLSNGNERFYACRSESRTDIKRSTSPPIVTLDSNIASTINRPTVSHKIFQSSNHQRPMYNLPINGFENPSLTAEPTLLTRELPSNMDKSNYNSTQSYTRNSFNATPRPYLASQHQPYGKRILVTSGAKPVDQMKPRLDTEIMYDYYQDDVSAPRKTTTKIQSNYFSNRETCETINGVPRNTVREIYYSTQPSVGGASNAKIRSRSIGPREILYGPGGKFGTSIPFEDDYIPLTVAEPQSDSLQKRIQFSEREFYSEDHRAPLWRKRDESELAVYESPRPITIIKESNNVYENNGLRSNLLEEQRRIMKSPYQRSIKFDDDVIDHDQPEISIYKDNYFRDNGFSARQILELHGSTDF